MLAEILCQKLESPNADSIVILVGALLCIVLPYLIGSINPAIVFSKMIYHDDIRTHGSGNAGTTNMLRTFGLKAAALTLACEFLKAILAVFLRCRWLKMQL